MMNGAGTGMLIPYSHVGRLALRVFNELKPLMDGPFGEGADVPLKAIGSIKLVISEGPLEQETFLTIDSFVEAINAIPDPVPEAHDSVLPVVGWESTERLECNCVREIGLDNKHGWSIEAMHSFPLPVNLDTKLSVRPRTNRKSRPARRAR